MRRALFVSAISLLGIVAIACGSDGDGNANAPTSTTGLPVSTATVPPDLFRMLQPGDSPAPPVGALDTSKSYTATMKTEKGDIVIELLDDIAPLYVENFVNLSRIGFYDGSTFHRVLENFMAQGGQGAENPSPGYQFADQFHPDMLHDGPGIVSMANAGLNTNTSQFFITHRATPHLNPYENGSLKPCNFRGVSCHAVFGRVIEGMDVVNSIRLRDPGSDPNPGDRIITVEIEES